MKTLCLAGVLLAATVLGASLLSEIADVVRMVQMETLPRAAGLVAMRASLLWHVLIFTLVATPLGIAAIAGRR